MRSHFYKYSEPCDIHFYFIYKFHGLPNTIFSYIDIEHELIAEKKGDHGELVKKFNECIK